MLFPGQGSQFVGMGADVFASRGDLLGEVADEILGWSLEETCLLGPEEQLMETDRAQPALYALAFALWSELAHRIGAPAAAAGHSLGEYTAHAAAGSFSYLDGLRLVSVRGRAMAEAANLAPGGMAALLGADVAVAEKAASERRSSGGRLWVANLNGPGQVVVAGATEDLEWLASTAGEHNIRRFVPLKVAGAFHTPMMEDAVAPLTEALRAVPVGEARFPVFANITALPTEDVASTLAAQVVAPVRFGESLDRMRRSGVEAFVHVGPGDVTAGMARRVAPEAEVIVVDDLESVETAVAQLS